ncbi:DUF4493 domain-containing protein [Flammeovirga sp. MY04]|uniref:Beta-mannanase n=1 Tax=Flammeovirga yaeyamensis TaxID=367791 RepID=D0PR29_9BACT|nr:DUF4493 domain-containing protein [Flammeovirga sp. MY04]ACY02072.1 beta-mannanase precursor [Flammeovirga yaeyamensis]ANQ52744.2 DUF4493 domain-containing protein [Flammeovirga sp. MY04]
MTMKLNMITNLLLLLFCITGCSSNDSPLVEKEGGKGKLSLTVNINQSVDEVDNARKLSTDDVKISIVNSDGQTVEEYASSSSIPEEIELTSGVYKAVGSSNSTNQFGFEDPQYGGTSDDFAIEATRLTSTTLECKLQNTKVTVEYSDLVKNQFNDYSSIVKSSFGELSFEKEETRAGYFRSSGNLTVKSIVGTGSALQNVEFVIENIQPQTHYKVIVDVESGSGKIVVTVDTSLVDGGEHSIIVTPIQGEARPDYNTSIGFFIKEGKLYDANGMEFIPKGVNNAHFWFDSGNRHYAFDALSPIAAYYSNSVRMVWQTNYQSNSWSDIEEATTLKRMFDEALRLGLVPMIELHDVTGDESKENLLKMAEFYVRPDILSVMKEYESVLLINIANEWSGRDTIYRDAYKEAITMMRNAGLKHTIVIDGSGWGQDMTPIFDYGQEILNHDPQKNILFSVHMYENYRNESTITTNLEKAVDMKLPLIVGEFGFQHGGTADNPIQIPYTHILSECERLGLGWYAWSWKGNSGGVEYLDLSTDWEGTTLSDWGNGIVNDVNGLKNTAKKVSVIN